MRQVGRLASEQEAEVFQDYLLTLGIETTVDAAGNDGAAVWVHDEDKVQQSREELDAFRIDPNGDLYQRSRHRADAIRKESQKKNEQAKKNQVDVRRRWSSGPAAYAPLTVTLAVLAFMATLAIQFGKRPEPAFGWLALTPRAWQNGEVWRFVTPIFMHFDVLHLLFNLYWTLILGTAVELRLRTPRYLLLVLVLAVISNLTQFISEGSYFGGLSGVGYGLFGYSWMKSKYDPSAGILLSPNLVFMFVVFFFIGWFGSKGIANMAHLGGLVSGMVIGYWPKLYRDLKRGGDF